MSASGDKHWDVTMSEYNRPATTHLEVWKDLWNLYCESFRENFGTHPVELSPVALETFACKLHDEIEKALRPEGRLISYETLQERCNELLTSLQAIRDSEEQSHSWCREVAAHTLDGDEILWGKR